MTSTSASTRYLPDIAGLGDAGLGEAALATIPECLRRVWALTNQIAAALTLYC